MFMELIYKGCFFLYIKKRLNVHLISNPKNFLRAIFSVYQFLLQKPFFFLYQHLQEDKLLNYYTTKNKTKEKIKSIKQKLNPTQHLPQSYALVVKCCTQNQCLTAIKPCLYLKKPSLRCCADVTEQSILRVW